METVIPSVNPTIVHIRASELMSNIVFVVWLLAAGLALGVSLVVVVLSLKDLRQMRKQTKKRPN